jgi:AcrR family transcriptional regulator
MPQMERPSEPSPKAPRRPRPYHHGNLREELIRRGKMRLAKQGLFDVSLRRIAADAGVSQVAPTHHFGNKEGLLAAIAASGFRDLIEFRLSRLRPGMSAEQRLRTLLSTYVVFAEENPALFHLMFAPPFKAPRKHAELNEAASQSYRLLADTADEYLRETEDKNRSGQKLTGDDVARMSWMCMHGLATLVIENRFNPMGSRHYTRDQLLKRVLDLIFAGTRALRDKP